MQPLLCCARHLHPLGTSPQAAHPSLLVEISKLGRAGGVTSAIALVVPVADELLPRTAVALGDGRVVELLRRDALQRLGIAWRWSRACGRQAGWGTRGGFSPSAPTPAHLVDMVGGGKSGAGVEEWEGCNAKVAPAKGTEASPPLEARRTGISSRGVDSGWLCDLGDVAVPPWACVRSVEGRGGSGRWTRQPSGHCPCSTLEHCHTWVPQPWSQDPGLNSPGARALGLRGRSAGKAEGWATSGPPGVARKMWSSELQLCPSGPLATWAQERALRGHRLA